jgi:hypothetical protein
MCHRWPLTYSAALSYFTLGRSWPEQARALSCRREGVQVAYVRFDAGDVAVSEDTVKVLNMQYIAGTPIEELSATIDRAPRTLRRWFYEEGLPMRPRGPQAREK